MWWEVSPSPDSSVGYRSEGTLYLPACVHLQGLSTFYFPNTNGSTLFCTLWFGGLCFFLL